MINPTIAHILNEMADLLELSNDNPFRIRAFRRAAHAIDTFPEDVGAFDKKRLLEIPGIGQGTAGMIEEFQKTGAVADHQKLRGKFPEGIFKIMSFPGLGAKRAQILLSKLKIDSLEKLQAAAAAGKIKKLDGFGEKMEANILANMSFAQESGKRLLITDALLIADEVLAHLKKSPVIENLTIAGSARRWKETVGDLDFLCSSKRPKEAITRFLSIKNQRVLAEGPTKASLVLPNGLQCDFRVVEKDAIGAALLYFTGSKEHNVRLRELAQKKNLTLNEYGLYKESDKDKKKPLASKTEEDIYKALGLPWIPPELREDRGEIEASLKNKLPRLVTEADVRGDFHNHTTLSDGAHSVQEMTEAAKKKGWKWYFCGDHSPSLTIANGLSIERLRSKMNVIKKLNDRQNGFKIFCSSEVDILQDGQMDYPDKILAELDAVVASVHSRFNQPEAEMTARIIKALENPHVDILGHLSGRLINKRKSYELNFEDILKKASETQTAIEINGQPDRQELSDVHVKRAVELGVPLVLSTDAHSTRDLGHMRLAVHIARRGWAEPKNIINTKSIDQTLEWLG